VKVSAREASTTISKGAKAFQILPVRQATNSGTGFRRSPQHEWPLVCIQHFSNNLLCFSREEEFRVTRYQDFREQVFQDKDIRRLQVTFAFFSRDFPNFCALSSSGIRLFLVRHFSVRSFPRLWLLFVVRYVY